MKTTKSKYVVNYLGDPIVIINAESLEEAKEKFDDAIVIDTIAGDIIESDNKYVEFHLMKNEIE